MLISVTNPANLDNLANDISLRPYTAVLALRKRYHTMIERLGFQGAKVE
jgi:hypothetical protein